MERELGVEEKDGIKEPGGGERWKLCFGHESRWIV